MSHNKVEDFIEFEVEGHKVWAVVKVEGNILARERIPRQYLQPDLDPEQQKWYFTGIAKRLKAKMKDLPVTGANGEALN